jgi:hypothetical protein
MEQYAHQIDEIPIKQETRIEISKSSNNPKSNDKGSSDKKNGPSFPRCYNFWCYEDQCRTCRFAPFRKDCFWIILLTLLWTFVFSSTLFCLICFNHQQDIQVCSNSAFTSASLELVSLIIFSFACVPLALILFLVLIQCCKSSYRCILAVFYKS